MIARDKIVLALGELHEANAQELSKHTAYPVSSLGCVLPIMWRELVLHRVRRPQPGNQKQTNYYSLTYKGNQQLGRLYRMAEDDSEIATFIEFLKNGDHKATDNYLEDSTDSQPDPHPAPVSDATIEGTINERILTAIGILGEANPEQIVELTGIAARTVRNRLPLLRRDKLIHRFGNRMSYRYRLSDLVKKHYGVDGRAFSISIPETENPLVTVRPRKKAEQKKPAPKPVPVAKRTIAWKNPNTPDIKDMVHPKQNGCAAHRTVFPVFVCPECIRRVRKRGNCDGWNKDHTRCLICERRHYSNKTMRQAKPKTEADKRLEISYAEAKYIGGVRP